MGVYPGKERQRKDLDKVKFLCSVHKMDGLTDMNLQTFQYYRNIFID